MKNRSARWGGLPGFRADHRWLVAGLFLVAMLPVMATPVLPLIDFYNHLSRFYILAHIGSSSLLQNYYQAAWGLLPDVGLDAAATLLLHFVPPLMGGHIIVISVLAILYGGVLYFHRMLTGQRSLLVAIVILPLLYSYILNWGFVNFLLGLGLTFWTAGFWLAHRNRPGPAMPVLCLLSVAIFLTHGIAFALYGVLTVFLEIGFFANDPSRNARSLVRSLSLLAAQAIIPILLFFLWQRGFFSAGALSSSAGATGNALDLPTPHTGSAGRRISTVLRVEEGPSYWLDVATFFLQIALAGFLIWRRKIAVTRVAWILIVVLIPLIVLTPQSMFGVQYIADRIPLVLGFCLLGSICIVSSDWGWDGKIAGALLVAVVFLRLLLITLDWSSYGDRYREYQSIASQLPPGSVSAGLSIGAGRHETDIPRCEMYGSLVIIQFDQIGPSFSSVGQHPLLLKGRLKDVVGIMENNPATKWEVVRDYGAYLKVAASAGIDYVLICNAHLLHQDYPPEMTLVARTQHFSLLRAVKS